MTLHTHPLTLSTLLAATALVGCAYPAHEQAYETGPAPPAPAVYAYPHAQPAPQDYRRRYNETLYSVEVQTVRAIAGNSGQRCWMERGEVVPARPAANVPGAIVGGVIGGILGHQIGGGSGRDIATVGGVVAGAAIGSHVGRDRYGNPAPMQDVQRCASDPGARTADYWEVSYVFRGVTHTVQMTSPPGRSITVNGNGEPRI